MTPSLLLEIAGFLIGLLYLWWEYHASPKLWFASLVMPAISMWIYFGKGLYADFAINIYYLAIAIYGYISWTRRRNSEANENGNSNDGRNDGDASSTELRIRHVKPGTAAASTAVFLMIWGAIYLVLADFTNSTVPVYDAFTTALSIVGMWMLARKYIEQWMVWIVVDIACVGLYIYKEIYLYAILYAIYTVIAIFGYRKWLRLMQSQS